jgi:hypothetical protein
MGEVNYVIAFVIRQMDLEQVQIIVDLLHQAQALGQRMNGTQPATTDCARALGDLIVKVAALEYRFRLLREVLLAQPARTPLLISLEGLGGGFVHLKGALSAVDYKI